MTYSIPTLSTLFFVLRIFKNIFLFFYNYKYLGANERFSINVGMRKIKQVSVR